MGKVGCNVGKPMDEQLVPINAFHPSCNGELIEMSVREVRELSTPKYTGDSRTLYAKWCEKHWDETNKKEK